MENFLLISGGVKTLWVKNRISEAETIRSYVSRDSVTVPVFEHIFIYRW